MEKGINKFEIIYINEKKVNISYPNVENKGSRPYVVINPNISHNNILVCPMTALKSKDFGTSKNIKDSWFVLEEESIIKLDHIFIISKKEVENGNIETKGKIIEPRYQKKILKIITDVIND